MKHRVTTIYFTRLQGGKQILFYISLTTYLQTSDLFLESPTDIEWKYFPLFLNISFKRITVIIGRVSLFSIYFEGKIMLLLEFPFMKGSAWSTLVLKSILLWRVFLSLSLLSLTINLFPPYDGQLCSLSWPPPSSLQNKWEVCISDDKFSSLWS